MKKGDEELGDGQRTGEEEKRKNGSTEGWAPDMKPCTHGVSREGLQLKPQSIKERSFSKRGQ